MSKNTFGADVWIAEKSAQLTGNERWGIGMGGECIGDKSTLKYANKII